MNLGQLYSCGPEPLPMQHGAILGKRIHQARLRSSGTILRSPLPAGVTRETSGLTRLDMIELAIRDAGRPLFACDVVSLFPKVKAKNIRASLSTLCDQGRLRRISGDPDSKRYRYAASGQS